MEVLYNNLYFTTKDRVTVIEEEHRDRIEKTTTIYAKGSLIGNLRVRHFQFQKKMLTKCVNTLKINPFTIRNKPMQKNMIIF